MSGNKDSLDMAELGAILNEEDQVVMVDFMNTNVMKRINVLREIQWEHDELEAKFLEEKAALEAKYQKLYQPLYTKRCQIVNGVIEVEGTTNITSQEQVKGKLIEVKGVPFFWLMALRNNEILAKEITEKDEFILQYLKDIKWCRIDEPQGFKLEFFFDTNPYLKNTVLTKTYHMTDEEESSLEKAIGTEIDWYPGKCLTQKTLKKITKKGSDDAKPLSKTKDCQSFFNFFNPPAVPDDDDEELDEEAAEELQNLIEYDYDIGITIRDKIIPRAVSWFTGEAMEGDDLDSEDDEDDEIYDHDDEEEDSEESEDDNKEKNEGGIAQVGEAATRI